MKNDYVEPFLEATVNVLKTMAFTEIVPGEPFMKDGEEAFGDVTGIVGLTGDTKGSMSVTFSKSCIYHIISRMTNETVVAINEQVKDAVGEITNMISGDARRYLGLKGISLAAAIPSIITGPGHTVTHLASGPTLAIPFSSEFGSFTVEVAMIEK